MGRAAGVQFYQLNASEEQSRMYRKFYQELLDVFEEGAEDDKTIAQVLKENKELIKKERRYYLTQIAKKTDLKEICSQIGVEEVGVKATLAERILDAEFRE